MKKPFDNIEVSKKRKVFSILSTTLLLFFIIQTLGCVIVQLVFKTDVDLIEKTKIPCLGMEFTTPIFATLLSSFSNNAQMIVTVNSIVTIVFALLCIFLAMSITKNKKWALYTCSSLYLFDTVLIIPTLIINSIKEIFITLSVVDYILIILLHLIGVTLFIFIYLFYSDEKDIEKENGVYVGGNKQ